MFPSILRSTPLLSILLFSCGGYPPVRTDAGQDGDQETDSDEEQPCTDGDPATSQQIAWLRHQIGADGLVDSYQDDRTDWAYTYDQALSIIAFTAAGETCEARQIIQTLSSLQNPDGSWYNCYITTDSSVCEPLQHTGPIAWVVMALNYYQSATGDTTYASMATSALGWLDHRRNTTPESEIYGSLNCGPAYSAATISTEHNLDSWSAFYNFGLLTDNAAQIEKANLIEDYLLAEMWGLSSTSNGPYEIGVFWRGYNDFAWCTDPQSWAVLALGPSGPHTEPLSQSLDWLTSNGYGFGSTRNSQEYSTHAVDGFSFCTEDVNLPNGINPNFCGTLFIWTEGTLGVASALAEAGDAETADYFYRQISQTITPDGGVPYSFSSAPMSFPCNWPYAAAAPTAWYYFYENGINPFQFPPARP